MPEYCESMIKKEELDEQFFDDGAVVPSITIFNYEHRQKIWDSLRQDTRRLRTEMKGRKKWSKQSKRLPLLPEKSLKVRRRKER